MKTVSTFDAISKMLPAVQVAVKEEIVARIEAGEAISGIDSKLEAELAKKKRALIGVPAPFKGSSQGKAKAGLRLQRQSSKLSVA